MIWLRQNQNKWNMFVLINNNFFFYHFCQHRSRTGAADSKQITNRLTICLKFTSQVFNDRLFLFTVNRCIACFYRLFFQKQAIKTFSQIQDVP